MCMTGIMSRTMHSPHVCKARSIDNDYAQNERACQLTQHTNTNSGHADCLGRC